jgi:hypothetical protein
MSAMPEKVRNLFYLSQVGMGALFLLAAWLILRGRQGASQFRTRESELRPGGKAKPGGADNLANARMRPAEKKGPALALPGVRLEGTPHQILGLPEGAGEEEIQRAYRDLMKRFHPDKVGAAPGTPAWKDAQKVAEIINRARADALTRAGKVRS